MGESWEIEEEKKIKNQRYNISSDGVIEGVRTDQEILQLHFLCITMIANFPTFY